MKTALHYALILLGLYIALLVVFRIFEKQIIFLPNLIPRLSGDWQPPGLPIENVELTTSDGVKLHAWWIPAPDAEFTFVAFHGNAGNITHRADVYAFLRGLPANVLAVEYRGYGRSEGSPDEPGIYRDAEAGFEYLVKQKQIPPGKIVAYGQSLGTAAAADVGTNRGAGGIVLEAPFPSTRATAARVYWFLPGLGLIAGTKFDTAAKLPTVQKPVLIVHCKNDPVIPFALGEQVYAAAGEPKHFFQVDGYCHEETFLVAPAKYREELRKFLGEVRARHGLPPPS